MMSFSLWTIPSLSLCVSSVWAILWTHLESTLKEASYFLKLEAIVVNSRPSGLYLKLQMKFTSSEFWKQHLNVQDCSSKYRGGWVVIDTSLSSSIQQTLVNVMKTCLNKERFTEPWKGRRISLWMALWITVHVTNRAYLYLRIKTRND